MSRIARYAKSTAAEGKGEELAGILLAAAGQLQADPSCELYLVSRQKGQPDVVWVTELWRSQAALDASLERIRGNPDVARAISLVQAWETIELDLLGGKGAEAG